MSHETSRASLIRFVILPTLLKTRSLQSSRRMLLAWGMVSTILLIGVLDYVTGLQIRVYPLYFVPLSVLSIAFGRRGAAASSILVTLVWFASNFATGEGWSGETWALNTIAQFVAFATVGALSAELSAHAENETLLARTDALTGLCNVRGFIELTTIVGDLARRQSLPVTLAVMDLDNFKCVNDTHGHERGNQLLRDVADVIRKGTRSSDVSARWGGDEFVVCLTSADEAQARVALERIRTSLVEVFNSEPCRVSTSIGAVSWGIPPADVRHMIQEADKVMYQVKHSGKNSLRVMTAQELSCQLAESSS